ncbi:putative cystathionine gamma-synthase/beta-lyase [Schizothecium vesticola]|uniref:Cystathionine gamma-synthase/beta-lyase n=1 Tax=Schizothecium vesticola TaxID=314040 RepID=A0AA40EE69_9PEZI|nr:putative cystathionine gamma-synthase/beta-lyase [Schizothecium vesticola]
MLTIATPELLVLGGAVPPGDAHAVSVQLPTWADTVGWSVREPRVVNALLTGYPRFMIPRTVTSLSKRIAKKCLEGGGFKSQSVDKFFVLLVSTYRHAALCQRSLRQKMEPGVEPSDIAVMEISWDGTVTRVDGQPEAETASPGLGKEPIFAITHPTELQLSARYFWQHTGFGISSRRSDFWLEQGPFGPEEEEVEVPVGPYDANEVNTARAAMRSRIAAGNSAPEENVFLYSGGMAAITETAMAIQTLRDPEQNSSCCAAVFGFLYVDTFKVLTNILGYETTLYKYSDADVDQLEDRLRAGDRLDVVFTEFPGNPLLQCPDLGRLYKLSIKYKFLLVVDDTVGCYANVSLIASCDIICTSLTKMFSGGCNVMGGSAVVSPHSPFADDMRAAMQAGYQPGQWFPADVLVMEKNSRDFVERTRRASANAAAVAYMLRNDPLVEEVYYPKGSPTQHIYDSYKLPEGGYGFLMSFRFRSSERAAAFYDALETAKGPSLGTNFTLSCAYTILAHPHEMEWAASYGVVKELIRISIGLEGEDWLKARVQAALDAASRVD